MCKVSVKTRKMCGQQLFVDFLWLYVCCNILFHYSPTEDDIIIQLISTFQSQHIHLLPSPDQLFSCFHLRNFALTFAGQHLLIFYTVKHDFACFTIYLFILYTFYLLLCHSIVTFICQNLVVCCPMRTKLSLHWIHYFIVRIILTYFKGIKNFKRLFLSWVVSA